MVDTGLKNKVVLVTGANNPEGIGASVAKAFAAEGTRIFIHYFRRPLEGTFKKMAKAGQAPVPGEARYRLNQSASAESVLEVIREQGGSAEAWEADLADPATIPELFDRAEKSLGPVDVLVNNAADWEADTFIPTSKDLHTWHQEVFSSAPKPISTRSHSRLFAVNTHAVALMMAEYARRHVERGAGWGRIINVSSDGASGFPSEVSYGASKFAMESYSRAAAHELGRYGITVNVVSLGPIQTGWISPDLEARLLPEIPLGRLGQPEDVANVITFLASNQARWVTGQVLFVGGGHKIS